MNKLFILTALLALPAFAQEEGSPAPDRQGPHRGGMMMHGGPGMMMLINQLGMEKYDVDKDGKISDSEKETIKADAESAREAMKKEMEERRANMTDEEKAAFRKAREERAQKREGKGEGKGGEAKDGDKPERPRGEGRRGGRPHGEARGERPDGPGAVFAPVARPLLKEKYDADKDGKLSKEETDKMHADAKALAEAKRAEKKADDKKSDDKE